MKYEILEKLLRAVESDSAFKTQLQTADTAEAKAAVAAKRGISLTAQDFKNFAAGGQLSEAELEGAAGGGGESTAAALQKKMHDLLMSLIQNMK